MKYSVKQLSKEEFLVLIESFSGSYLSIPIIKAPKLFESKTKGFRLNKLPRNILHMLYYDDIFGSQNSILEKHLISNMSTCFNETGISELLENFRGTVLELAAQLEIIISKNDLKISPHTILLVCEYDCSSEDINTIKAFHIYNITVTTHQKSTHETTCSELKKHFEEEAKEQEQKSSFKYKDLEMKYQTSLQNFNDCMNERDRLVLDVKHLNNNLTETTRLVDTMRYQLRDYDTLSKKAADQHTEILYLNEQIEKLNDVIQNLETKVLSPDDVLYICREVLDDLNSADLEERELKKVALNIFSHDLSIVDAWKLLGDIDKKNIENVYSEMEKGRVSDSRITDLDSIENNVYIRFMIIKSLKVVFFRFLEQNIQKSNIKKPFRSEEK